LFWNKLGAVVGLAVAAAAEMGSATPPEGIVLSELVYDRAPFPAAHASTIVETRTGLVAAWFGGTGEGRSDVGIWVARKRDATWSAPEEVARGAGPDGRPQPCWNPVLFLPSTGPLLLFYKVGPSPREWWAEVRASTDEGRTWSQAVALPSGILGPIRAKPVELPSREMLAGSSTEHAGWVVHLERFVPPRPGEAWRLEDLATPRAWRSIGPLNDPAEFGAIQPTILVHSATRLQILCRSRQGVVTEAWSDDQGRSWARMAATALPNPSAGIDALRLADGRFLLVYNPTAVGRARLDVALSADGKDWRKALVLEDAPGEHSYPAAIQTRDGLVHVTYTWRRERIKHVVIDPSRLSGAAR
jgi:predicted neuraminidase